MKQKKRVKIEIDNPNAMLGDGLSISGKRKSDTSARKSDASNMLKRIISVQPCEKAEVD